MHPEIIQGDSLQILKDFPDRSMDTVLTDPPYMIGLSSVGDPSTKAGTWADMENSAYWYAAWMKECKRILKDTGFLLCFGNWRSIPTLIRALSLADMPASSCLIWDKEKLGTSSKRQLRPRYEIVMFSAMPKAQIPDRRASDIYTCKWYPEHMRQTKHPAEKPIDLMRYLIRLVTPEGGTVLDPFLGSGTTAVAAALEGRRFIGIEREAEYVKMAKQRIKAIGKKVIGGDVNATKATKGG